MLEYRYDTQLLIDGHDLDEDEIYDYFVDNFKGDCLLAVGDEEMIKIHYHTNEPWKVLEYCAGLGEIYDIVVEDMDRQARGLKGGVWSFHSGASWRRGSVCAASQGGPGSWSAGRCAMSAGASS